MNYPKNWEEKNGRLVRTFSLNDFYECVKLLNNIVPLTKRNEHHPDVIISDYKNIRIELITHDEKRITTKDIDMAEKINHIFDIQETN